jgi:CRP-like cAMP-binding protein
MPRRPKTADFLAHLPLLRGIRPDELARIEAGTTRRSLARGDTLFRQGDPNTGFHAVVYGRIALHARSGSKGERLADVIGPGRSFGEAVMFLEKPYIVSARALADSLVLHVDKETVFAALERNPRLARRMIASLAEKLHATVRAGSKAATVTLPGTKRSVASKLNLSPEHFSRILAQLARQGLIGVDGRRITIPDPDRLRDWSGSNRASRAEP